MRSRGESQRWLEQSRKSWTVLTQAAVWVLGVIGGFLLPPPVGAWPGEEKVWLRLAQFVVTVMIGLVLPLLIVTIRHLRQRHH